MRTKGKYLGGCRYRISLYMLGVCMAMSSSACKLANEVAAYKQEIRKAQTSIEAEFHVQAHVGLRVGSAAGPRQVTVNVAFDSVPDINARELKRRVTAAVQASFAETVQDVVVQF